MRRTLSPPKSFWEELKPWSYYSRQSILKLLARPFVFALSPAVWFTFFACKLLSRIFALGFTVHPFMKLVWPFRECSQSTQLYDYRNFAVVGRLVSYSLLDAQDMLRSHVTSDFRDIFCCTWWETLFLRCNSVSSPSPESPKWTHWTLLGSVLHLLDLLLVSLSGQ